MWQTPDTTPEAATRRLTSEVMFTHSVRRDVFKCSVSTREFAGAFPEKLMKAK
jgi:hypothetical protein